MPENRFVPPTAEVADVLPIVAGGEPFFAVSLLKLAVLSLCTLGIYEVYWFYRNWQLVRQRDRRVGHPVWRALFAVFFCYPLFKRIREEGIARSIAPPLAAGPLAACWIVASLLWRLPDPYWLVTLIGVGFMLPVQAHVNRIDAAAEPAHDPNARFSAWNWVGVVLGGAVLLLAIVGAFMADQPA